MWLGSAHWATEKAGQVLGEGRQGTPYRKVAEYKEMWPQFGTPSYYLGGQGQKDREAQGFGVGCLEDAFDFSGPASTLG